MHNLLAQKFAMILAHLHESQYLIEVPSLPVSGIARVFTSQSMPSRITAEAHMNPLAQLYRDYMG